MIYLFINKHYPQDRFYLDIDLNPADIKDIMNKIENDKKFICWTKGEIITFMKKYNIKAVEVNINIVEF